jgi:hypothetical protein
VDRLLRMLATRAARRGFGGEPVWLAVAVAAWLVRRARRPGPAVVWQGRVAPGQRLIVTAFDHAVPAPGGPGEG